MYTPCANVRPRTFSTSAITMWPPSSGSTGNKLSKPSARLIRPRTKRNVRSPARQAPRTLDDAVRARHLARVAAGRDVGQPAHSAGRDVPREVQCVARRPRGPIHPGRHVPRSRCRSDRRPAPSPPERDDDALAVAVDQERERASVRRPMCAGMSFGATFCRRRRGPGRRPGCALRPRCTGRDLADDVRLPRDRDEEQRGERRIANTRLTTGPARIAVNRRHVAARQYASRASEPSSSCQARVSPSFGLSSSSNACAPS